MDDSATDSLLAIGFVLLLVVLYNPWLLVLFGLAVALFLGYRLIHLMIKKIRQPLDPEAAGHEAETGQAVRSMPTRSEGREQESIQEIAARLQSEPTTPEMEAWFLENVLAPYLNEAPLTSDTTRSSDAPSERPRICPGSSLESPEAPEE